jgi:hypothetical protein
MCPSLLSRDPPQVLHRVLQPALQRVYLHILRPGPLQPLPETYPINGHDPRRTNGIIAATPVVDSEEADLERAIHLSTQAEPAPLDTFDEDVRRDLEANLETHGHREQQASAKAEKKAYELRQALKASIYDLLAREREAANFHRQHEEALAESARRTCRIHNHPTSQQPGQRLAGIPFAWNVSICGRS